RPSSAHTYRLLIFKEHFCEEAIFLSSTAFSAAEKRDYEPLFPDRQQLFELLRCDGWGFNSVCAKALQQPRPHRFPSFLSRAAFPLARKRRDSKHPPSSPQAPL
ncbi:hypothetical protein, partial [Burkholderia anthina]|uniref:hypothetical protein n=1 Tax=Burkholderia anthina TaxID=179879 RepID=UPI001ABA7D10